MIPLPAPAPFALWQVDLADWLGPGPITTLSTAEHQRAARFVFERDRRRYLAAHCALRALLSTRTGVPADEIEFREGAFGKPFLPREPRCAFNMSHSEDFAWIAMADAGEIGIDIEVLRPMPDALALAHHHFSAAEYDELVAMPVELHALAFLSGWTRKEACLKAIGSGLSIAPNVFTAGLAPGPRSVRITTPEGIANVWVDTLPHGADIIGSLARIESGC